MPSVAARIDGTGSAAAVISYSSTVPAVRSHSAAEDAAIVLGDVAPMPKEHHPSPLAEIKLHVTANVVFPPTVLHASEMEPSGESKNFVGVGIVGAVVGTVPGAIVGALVGAVGAFVGALVGATAKFTVAESRSLCSPHPPLGLYAHAKWFVVPLTATAPILLAHVNENALAPGYKLELSIAATLASIPPVTGSLCAVRSYSFRLPSARFHTADEIAFIVTGCVGATPKAHHPSDSASFLHLTVKNVLPAAGNDHHTSMAPSGEDHISCAVVVANEGVVVDW